MLPRFALNGRAYVVTLLERFPRNAWPTGRYHAAGYAVPAPAGLRTALPGYQGLWSTHRATSASPACSLKHDSLLRRN